MAVPNVREQVEAKLDQLSDEELTAILHYIEAMKTTDLPADYDEANDPAIGFFEADPDFATRAEEILNADYDEANDPSVGMFSGPTDLSRRARQILYDEITPRSGWTQKKD